MYTVKPVGAVSQPALCLSPSYRLIWEVWMPFVRNIVTQWQPRNCEPMVDFLDSWVHIIPVWILDNILDQLIFPKLQKEVGPESGNELSSVTMGTHLAFLFMSVLLKYLQLTIYQHSCCHILTLALFSPKPQLIWNSFSWFIKIRIVPFIRCNTIA